MIVKDIPSIYKMLASLEHPFRVLKIEAKDDFFREDCVEKYIDFWKKNSKTGTVRRISGTELLLLGESGEFCPGLFSEKTLWVVEGLGSLKGQKVESACSYIRGASEDHCFLGVDKETSLKGLEVDATIVFPSLKPWERQPWLIKWIEAYCKKQDKRIESSAAHMLAVAFANDRRSLVSEVEKLLLYCLYEKNITLSDVQVLSACDTQPTMWQLLDALLQKDSKTVVTCLLAADMNDIGVLRFVKNQLQKLIVATQEGTVTGFKSQERQIACVRKIGVPTVIAWVNRLEREDVNIRAGTEENGVLLPLFLSFFK